MAGSLLCLIFGLTAEGCILPQNDNVIPTPSMNSAPRIVTHAPQELVTTAYVPRGASSCSSETTGFEIFVEDDDTTASDGGGYVYRDRINHRWFIDGAKTTVNGKRVEASTEPRREVKAPSDFPTRLSEKADDSSRHLVEVYVTDGSFGEGVDNPMPEPGQNQAYVASFAWFVEIRSCQ